MNRITRHDMASSPNTDVRPQAARSIRHPASLSRGRVHAISAATGILGTAAVAAVLFGSSPAASAAPAQSARGAAGLTSTGSPANSMLTATFTSGAVSVTSNLGMVELILTGTGTVQGFGAATEVVGLIQDHAVTPCGAGSYSDTASRRIVMSGGMLILHEAGMTCMTSSGLQASATYHVDGQASTGIFAGARGTGNVIVDVVTHQETLSGTLILNPRAA